MSINLQELREALGGLSQEERNALLGVDPRGRTPIKPRQLHDLRLPPTKDDARPLFVFSAEGDRNVPHAAGTPYPKLLWSQSGVEITVQDKEQEAEKIAEGYVLVAPQSVILTPAERARQLFESLSTEDQQLVLEMQRKAKIDAVSKAMEGLTPGQLAEAFASPVEVKKSRKSA